MQAIILASSGLARAALAAAFFVATLSAPSEGRAEETTPIDDASTAPTPGAPPSSTNAPARSDATDEKSERGVDLGTSGVVYGSPVLAEHFGGIGSLAFVGAGLRVSGPIAGGKARIGVIGEGFRSIEGLGGGALGIEFTRISRFGAARLGIGGDAHWLMVRRTTEDAFLSFLLFGGHGLLGVDLVTIGRTTLALDVRPRVAIYWIGFMYGGTAGLSVRLP